MPRFIASFAVLLSFIPAIASGQCQLQKALSLAPQPESWFGFTVAITPDLAVVGAPRADSFSADSGQAYVYRRNGVQWNHEETLTWNSPGQQLGAVVRGS